MTDVHTPDRPTSPAAAAAVAKARQDGRRRKVTTGLTIVAVTAVVVLGGVLINNASRNGTEGASIAADNSSRLRPEFAGTRDGVSVLSGSPSARLTLDIYADFLCPQCGKFQQSFAKTLEQHVNSGELRLRYHMVPLLVDASDPPGYSLDAANASLCAADAGKFVPFHDSLFAHQPKEGVRGYDKGQLTDLGTRLGITGPTFADCVTTGTYDEQLRAMLDTLSKDPALLRDGGRDKVFATPTIVADGTIVDIRPSDWLTSLLTTTPNR